MRSWGWRGLSLIPEGNDFGIARNPKIKNQRT